MKEHIADRVTRYIRPFVIASFVVSGPVFVLSYVYMFRALIESLGPWVWPVFVAHILTWLAIGSLFDIRQERLNRPRD